MPELNDAIYCHQQICIPPIFPYLLRQYAKAAIRSQPNDLLRWSSAYFRALALGLRPPTKLRLEYPIPRSHYGLTPGWLKTLLYQLTGTQCVTWPQIYDRWQGACLQIPALQEIILLGGFPDPARIPWYRFIAVAAAHLTTCLTNTMILICELLTDEPEGGNAMIPSTTFIDLYKFLAKINACKPRLVRNFYYTESNLDLTKRESSEEYFSGRSIESTDKYREDYTDLTATGYSDLERYLNAIAEVSGEEELIKTEEDKSKEIPRDAIKSSHSSCFILLDPEDGKICHDTHAKSESSDESSETTEMMKVETIVSRETLGTEEMSEISIIDIKSKESEEMSSVTTSEEMQPDFLVVELAAVPGIGPVVPDEMIDAVVKYVKDCASKQQGMIMPRHIKHFLCPPLEACID